MPRIFRAFFLLIVLPVMAYAQTWVVAPTTATSGVAVSYVMSTGTGSLMSMWAFNPSTGNWGMIGPPAYYTISSYSGFSFGNVGTWQVKVVNGTASYSPTYGSVITVNVTSPVTPTTFTVSPTSFTYDGSAKGPTITPSPSNATYATSGTTSAINPGNYTVQADANGSFSGSSGSVPWTIAKANQSVAFNYPLGTVTYGPGPFYLYATASSGLSPTFSIVSGPAFITNGNQIVFTGTGTVVAGADQAGNAFYNAAPQATQTITVNPASTTFSLSATSFIYNGSAQGPSVVPSPSGATFTTGGTLNATAVGTYTATATATGNYTGSNSALTWTIGKANQAITFNNPGTQAYGTPLTLNATASSGLGVSYSVASGPATIAGNVVTFTGTGTVTITAAQGGDANWNAATNVSQSFTVNPAATTFSLSSTSFTYTGAAQGPSIVTSPAGATYTSGGTLSATAPGSYTATATATGNYTGSNTTLSWTIGKANQTITFNNPGAQTFGNTLTLGATASSGLALSYSVASGPATVSGNVVTFTGTGTVTITAAQGGDANWNAATSVSQSFSVNAAPTTFSLSATSFTYTGSAQGPSVVASPAAATYSTGGTLSATAAGSYTATATATGNYTGSNTTLAWTIGKANQAITFNNPGTQIYGSPLTLNATASSGLTVSYSVTSGPATIAGNVVTFTGTGSVTIAAAQAGNANYNAATSVSQTFSVNSAAVTFALSATSFPYNGAAQGPTVVATPSGATFTTGGTLSATALGTYTATATATGNYTGSNTNLGWSIVQGTQSITFNNPGTQVYGTPLTLSATASSGLAVSYAVASGPATVSGNVVTFTGTGPVTITASQAGNANYAAATSVSQTFTVNPAPVTFALNPTVFLYNGSVQGPAVVATPSGATFTTGGTLTASALGTYTATATATGNYTGSNSSLTWTITNGTQTITFNNPGAQTYLVPLTLSASASSGLPVSYAVTSGPATLSGNVVTFTGTGSVTITATQSGDTNYAAATPVSQTFTVNPAPTTFALSATTFYYNGAAQGPTVSATPGSATFTTGGTLSATLPGSYTATATATGNYTGANAALTWTMAKGNQTVTFSNPGAQTYLTPLTLTASASSGLPVSLAVTSGPATVSGNVVTFTGAGSVTITASQAGNANWNAAPNVSQTFTVNPAAQTITFANPGSQNFGNNLTLTATASSGLTVTYGVTSGPATIAGNVASFTGAGSVTITASQAGNANYTAAAPVSQTFTVNKVTPTGAFASRTLNIATLSYTVQSTDLNATFTNPNSTTVTAPSGAVSYSITAVNSTAENLAVVAGTTVLAGGNTYTIQANYPGDTNYNAAVATATWTVTSTALQDPDKDGLTNAAEANLGTNAQVYDTGRAVVGGSIPAGWPNVGNTANTYAVGATAGTLNIDKSGSANYSIALWTTPGTAGMEPKLSLNYSSQAGSGWLGYGWSLSGASAITRGPQTLAVDGQIKGLSYTYNDRFYMDGQRLIYISGGTGYGTDGAEYRTELDSVSKIISYGVAGNGPAYFRVWTKAGLIIEFGNTTDSAAVAQGRTEVATWAVNRISDTKGNYMDYQYALDTANGEQRLARINYTGNSAASTAPYASIRLTYEARTDTFAGYQAGSKVSRTQRIKKIGSYYGESLAREYTLDYVERPNTGRSIVTALHEKGTDGKEYPPLTFDYETASSGWNQPDNNTWGAPVPIAQVDTSSNPKKLAPPRGTGFVDLNGDGRPDFVQYHHSAAGNDRMAWINTVNGWVAADGSVAGVPDWRIPVYAPVVMPSLSTALAVDGSADSGTRLIDIDGDGLPDVFFVDGTVYQNTGSGFAVNGNLSIPIPLSYDSATFGKPTFIDLDGDGRVDLVAKVTYHWIDAQDKPHTLTTNQAWLNKAAGWQLASGYYPPFDLEKGSLFIDINGDGLPDQVQYWYGSNTTVTGVALNTGSGWNVLAAGSADFNKFLPPQKLNAGTPTTNNAPVGAEVVDLNGDGLPDLLYRSDSEGTNTAYFNTGNGWVQAPIGYNSPLNLTQNNVPQGVTLMDVNGDGLADLVYGWEATNRDVRLGTSSGWSASVSSYNIVRQISQADLPGTGTDFVDINGDGAVDQIWNLDWNGITKGAAFSLATTNDRLVKVTNGLGVAATLSYAPLTERDATGAFTIYDKGAIGTGPTDTVNVIGPMWVVKSVSHDDGVGGQYSLTYRYGGLRTHRVRGSQGFEWQQVTDSRNSMVSKTTFNQVFPFTGMPVASETRASAGGTILSTSSITYGEVAGLSAGTHMPYATQTVESSYELNGSLINTTTTAITGIDTHGNVTGMTVSTSDGFTKTTTNQYTQDDAASWLLGRLTNATVVSNGPAGVESVTRTSSFHYNTSNGLLDTETVEPNDATQALTTTYGYDAFGNKTSVTVSGANIVVDDATGNVSTSGTVSRTTTSQYDTNGRFPSWTKNALNHQESYTGYDQVQGVLTQLTGANGLVTSWQYDGFGRKILESRADGTQTSTTYKWGGADSPSGTAYFVEGQASGSAPGLTFYDSFGRARYSAGVSGDGRIVWQQSSFDSMGRANAKSMPYFAGGAVYWTQTTGFDLLNRPLTVQTPDDENGTQTTSYSYNGFTTSATDPLGRVAQTVKNSQGWTTSNTRNQNALNNAGASTVGYTYDAAGNLRFTNAAGIQTELRYDTRGRKITMLDPDMGTWSYRYDIFGELVWQKDAKGQIVKLGYDALGRMTSRVESEGTTNWTYDSATGKGIGKVASVSSPGGYVESYDYDNLGRVSATWRTIPGVSNNFLEPRFSIGVSYDSYSRPLVTTYPSKFQTRNVYNTFGYLKEVRKYLATDDTLPINQLQGFIYWQADTYDAGGRVNGEIYGNGLVNDRVYSQATGRLRTAIVGRGIETGPTYSIQYLQYTHDAVGNVTYRNDGVTNRTENFNYDGLDRLKTHALSGAVTATVTVNYDTNGNITSKSDVGAYSYVGYGPHAVSSAGSNSYVYDANGNMVSGAARTLQWTSYNQLRRADLTGGKFAQFDFGAGHERIKQSSHLGTTVYIGSLFERYTPNGAGAISEDKNYIFTPTGRVAVYTLRSDMTSDTRWFHTDGLGSITAITDEAGGIVKRFAFDAWGNRLNPSSNGVINSSTSGNFTRGFTDHEHLEDLGLIHMNGRVYDPVLGRFLSADPNVDDASDAQGFNRYSYVGNNPLGATDPTGFFSLKDGLKIVAIVAAGIITAGAALYAYAASFTVGFASFGGALSCIAGGGFITVGEAIVAGAAGGFASGFAGSLLNGGSVGDAFKAGIIGGVIGGVTGGLTYGIGSLSAESHWKWGETALAHGTIQGAANEATGGQFRHGFYAGFASSALAPNIQGISDSGAIQVTAAAAVGGTVSVIGGGKFGNGAVSGAFTYMFNWASHSPFDVHRKALFEAIKTSDGKFTREDAREIIRASHDMDRNEKWNTPETECVHGLWCPRPGYSREDAIREWSAFVHTHFQNAVDLAASGMRKQAMYELGLAMHAVQDPTSPSHYGFQKYTMKEIEHPFSNPDSISHGLHELYYPGNNSALFQATQSVLNQFTAGRMTVDPLSYGHD